MPDRSCFARCTVLVSRRARDLLRNRLDTRRDTLLLSPSLMSVQIFLQGKLLGIEEFLYAPAQADADQVFTGRSHWIGLLSEVLPRALLAELGLAKILLGSSGGGQFLLVLPDESRTAAEAFLQAAAAEIAAL